MITFTNQLWAKVLWHNYRSPLAPVQKKGYLSHVWRGISVGSSVLKDGVDRGPLHVGDVGAGNEIIKWKHMSNGMFSTKLAYLKFVVLKMFPGSQLGR